MQITLIVILLQFVSEYDNYCSLWFAVEMFKFGLCYWIAVTYGVCWVVVSRVRTTAISVSQAKKIITFEDVNILKCSNFLSKFVSWCIIRVTSHLMLALSFSISNEFINIHKTWNLIYISLMSMSMLTNLYNSVKHHLLIVFFRFNSFCLVGKVNPCNYTSFL